MSMFTQHHPYRKPFRGQQLDPKHRMSAGLVGYWPCNENGGVLLSDVSGRGHHGVRTSTSLTSWTGGRFGPAIRTASGVCDFTNHDDFNFERTQAFSVGVWAGMVQGSSGSGTLFGKYNAGSALGYRISWQIAGGIIWGCNISASVVNRLTTTLTIAFDQRIHHVMFTYDGTTY